MEKSFFICSCFFHKHIYLKKYSIHIDYLSESQFKQEYSELFRKKGCDEDELKIILEETKAEIERRKQRGREHVERCEIVKAKYQKLYPDLYILDVHEKIFDPKFLEIVQYCRNSSATQEGLLSLLTVEAAPRVYSFPVFSKSFCFQFIEELKHYEESDVPKGRPNTMNNTGIFLSELGFDEGFMNKFREVYLQPISRLLYPECVGKGLDSHRSFIVSYEVDSGKQHKDTGLSSHYDNAEVTLNVSLGNEFVDGQLFFGDMKHIPMETPTVYIYNHVIGRGVIHRGQHIHGAIDICEGERYNLIAWMRSSSVRNIRCPRCGENPKLFPFEGYGDGFTK